MPATRVLLATATLALLAGPAATARADILVGGIDPAVGVGIAHPVFRLADDADGDVVVPATLGGPLSGLLSPMDLAHEPVEGVIYVSDHFGRAVRVFPANASGDPAPLRVLDPALLGQPRTTLPLPGHGELMVIASNCCIYTWPLAASGGDQPRLRAIVWGGNGGQSALNNPFSMIHLPASDEVAVADYGFATPANGRVVFHARTADGDVAPTRILEGPDTANVAGLAHDPASGRLFLLASVDLGGGERQGEIRVFDAAASGAQPALYRIAGPATGLALGASGHLSGLAIDTRRGRLLVSIARDGAPAFNSIVVFDLDASGDAAPLQRITGSGLGSGSIGRALALPTDRVFADGFGD